jgi:hypothetical protein
MTCLPGHLFDHLAASLLAGQPGDRLEFVARRIDQFLAFGLAVGETLLFGAEILVAPIEIALAPVECLEALIDTLLTRGQLALERGQLAMLFAHFAFGLRAHLDEQVFGL